MDGLKHSWKLSLPSPILSLNEIAKVTPPIKILNTTNNNKKNIKIAHNNLYSRIYIFVYNKILYIEIY